MGPLMLPRRSFIKASEQDSPRTAVRYCPGAAADPLWKVKAESSRDPIVQVERIEKYRGILGKLMVPDYTQEDIASDLIPRPSRFPRIPPPAIATSGARAHQGAAQQVPAWF